MAHPGRLYPYGYLFVLVPPVLLVGGVAIGLPYLLFLVLFAIGPFLRILFGNIPEETGEWSERMTTLLDRLPIVAAIFHFCAGALCLLLAVHNPPSGIGQWVGLGLSLWSSVLCAIPVAHELTHRRGFDRAVGSALAGLTGYPVLEGEHLRHHSVSGFVEQPEWPRVDESVWSFVARRLPHTWHNAWRQHLALRRTPNGSRFFVGVGTMAATAAAFAATLGWAGLTTYVITAVGIHIAVQAINFIQHWGLGTDNVPGAEEGRFSWECRCQFQGWLLLNIALHHSHHHRSATPYYRLAPHKGSARLPGSYIPLLFVSMIPPLWQKLMRPAVETWKADPAAQLEPSGYRIICLPVHYSEAGSERA